MFGGVAHGTTALLSGRSASSSPAGEKSRDSDSGSGANHVASAAAASGPAAASGSRERLRSVTQASALEDPSISPAEEVCILEEVCRLNFCRTAESANERDGKLRAA